MALVRVAQYNSTPTVVGDYQAQNAHLQAFTNQLLTQQFILDAGTAQPVIKQGCYVSHGGSLYVADADTAITGSPSDGSVYIRVSGTTSLTVEFVNDISGYSWNPVYTALTSGSYTLLPYLIVKASTVWTRYNFNPNGQAFGSLASLAVTGNATVGGTLGVTGAISGASVDTGQGANELYPMNQAVRTTDSPAFAAIDTGYGANEVFKISKETLAFGNVSSDVTKQVSSMAVDEIRFVSTTGTILADEVDVYNAIVLAPSGGTYLIAENFIGNLLSGGSAIWQRANDEITSIPINGGFIIRRLS